ncbi:hypothetical protein TH1_05070 [Thalassospira lucentensis MCCC 1A00383 = DSM 14000]|nr:hypothetical protein TH1_05070 [Thalassospira lucentensis MCCC 1A00383 = DSM 14000]
MSQLQAQEKLVLLKFVWDSSAIVNLKEGNEHDYSPAYSLWKDLSDNSFDTEYLNIIPSIAFFEVNATVSSKNRNHQRMLHDFYILGDNEIIYSIDEELIAKSSSLVKQAGFGRLRGADLIFACITKIEDAHLVTLDKAFQKHLSNEIKILDLNDSRNSAIYRDTLFQVN